MKTIMMTSVVMTKLILSLFKGNVSEVQNVDRIRTTQIAGILGVIHLIEGAYLLILKSKKRVGEIRNHVIWQTGEHEIIPFKRTNLHLSKNQVIFLVQQ